MEGIGIFSSLLQGEAPNTLYGLREENRNYKDLKSALLKRYRCTEDSFRMKFKTALPLETEDFASFINRISRLFDLWLESAQVKTGDFKQLHELILRDQIYESCHSEMVSFLKERDPKTIDDRKAAESFISCRPNAKLAKEPKVSSLVAVRQDKKGQGFVTGQHFLTQFQNRPTYSSRPRSQSVPRVLWRDATLVEERNFLWPNHLTLPSEVEVHRLGVVSPQISSQEVVVVTIEEQQALNRWETRIMPHLQAS